MKTYILLFFLTTSFIYSQTEYKYPYSDGIPVKIFKERREKILKEYTNNDVLILLSSDFFTGARSLNSKSSVSPNLYYLTGIPQQKAALVLIPGGFKINGLKVTEILFLENQSKEEIKWNGRKMNFFDAMKLLNCQDVMNINLLDSMLNEILIGKDTIYFDMISRTKHFSNDENHSECDIELISKLKTYYPELGIKTNIPLLSQMRKIKNEDEIRLIQKAVDISIEGHKALIKTAKPGLTEYQLQAEMEYQFMKSGAETTAYGSIVGSGTNSCYLHYQDNRDTINDGDMILFDCGAKYNGYCSDITRTIPANGVFSIEQRIIYDIVLEAMDSALIQCKPGNKFSNIHEKAKELISEKLLELSIITKIEDYEEYFPHGTSHSIGLNVHDTGFEDLLQPGNVLTIEPGIYIPAGSTCDERWWNIGIRIEDDVVITETGFINLSEKLPRNPEEIEEMMK